MKVQLRGTEYNLRRLTDKEYDEASRLARQAGKPLSQCPTCKTKDEVIPGSGGVRSFSNGTYRFRGEEHFCDCQAQIALYARYLLANIGDQYMRLDWDDYDGSESVRNQVATYLDKWEQFKDHGWGFEFGGPLGVGKTFAATHIGKELIKKGQQVFFIPFVEMVSAFEREDAEVMENRMRTTTYLVLDELLPPISDRQREFYAYRFEALIRHRTNFNLPTIITTNVKAEVLDEVYPRIYSLLAAKQMRVEFDGDDQRKGRMQLENLELILNDEVRPIT